MLKTKMPIGEKDFLLFMQNFKRSFLAAYFVFLMLLAGQGAFAQERAPLCPLPDLPEAITNNAVASLEIDGARQIFSFMGLGATKKQDDIRRSAYSLQLGDRAWQALPDLPVPEGRLASTALAAGGKLWILGGYKVAPDGQESSMPEVFAYDPKTRLYEEKAPIPVPVDDTVSFVYGGRYIYLVSGWAGEGNVGLVQFYDIENDRWERATDFPGKPVFGHAGAIVGADFVIADGVAVVGIKDGKRQFDTYGQGWLGTIDAADPREINWQRLPDLPGRGHYRMGAYGDRARQRIVFAGGTPTAYNYDGVGYKGETVLPSAHVFYYDLLAKTWVAANDKTVASMDHRGLLPVGDGLYSLGGMGEDARVLPHFLWAYGAQACPKISR